MPVWISSYMPNKVWDEIIKKNPNGATVNLLELVSNFTLIHVSKSGPWYVAMLCFN